MARISSELIPGKWGWKMSYSGKLQIVFVEDEDNHKLIGVIHIAKKSKGKRARGNADLMVRCLNEREDLTSEILILKVKNGKYLDALEERGTYFDANVQEFSCLTCVGSTVAGKFVHETTCDYDPDQVVGKGLAERKIKEN